MLQLRLWMENESILHLQMAIDLERSILKVFLSHLPPLGWLHAGDTNKAESWVVQSAAIKVRNCAGLHVHTTSNQRPQWWILTASGYLARDSWPFEPKQKAKILRMARLELTAFGSGIQCSANWATSPNKTKITLRWLCQYAPSGNRTRGECLEGAHVATTPMVHSQEQTIWIY